MIVVALAENAIQLVPDGTMLLHLVIVVAMVAVLNRTLFRPVNKVLEEREAQTKGRLSEARKLRVNLENALLRYERGLREARSTAYNLIDVERATALRQREERVAQVKDEIRLWVGEERSEIEHQAEEARKTLDVESNQSAMKIASQILHRPLNSSLRN
jgi:F-type H+-transporting ATPase subunit b